MGQNALEVWRSGAATSFQNPPCSLQWEQHVRKWLLEAEFEGEALHAQGAEIAAFDLRRLFKMAGTAEALEDSRGLIRREIRLNGPSPLAKHLGCGHAVKMTSRERCVEEIGRVSGVVESLCCMEAPARPETVAAT